MARKAKCVPVVPVYVALVRGPAIGTTETVRMSFYSPKGKPIDVARGRRLVSLAVQGREILSSHVEHGKVIIPDIRPVLKRAA